MSKQEQQSEADSLPVGDQVVIYNDQAAERGQYATDK